ncbi:cytochrome P450 [Nonomuraea sp. NPDC023979]|uniref:cytochrome P450 n=1 Tax=Nonomuraea sp. NPDC023979 TaxID=3154796 RepID=UPI0033D6C040
MTSQMRPARLGIRALLEYQRQGETWIERTFDRHGPIFTMWNPGVGRVAMLRDADHVRQASSARERLLAPFEGGPLDLAAGPRSILALEGSQHLQVRKLLLPPLRGSALERHRALMSAAVSRSMASWPVGVPFELLPHLSDTVFDIFLGVLLGVEGDRLAAWRAPFAALRARLHAPSTQVRYMMRRTGAVAAWRSFHRLRERCVRLIGAEIERRRRDPAGHGDDVLGSLMAARTPSGSGLTDAALCDQMMALLLAGHETTAVGLAWTVERLLRHPEAMARLTAEALAGDGEAFATAVACEALRQRPPVAFKPLGVTRHACRLGPYVIEPRTTLLVHLRSLHHDARHFPAPSAFRPERFLDTRPAPGSWLPFGLGAHLCPGKPYTMAQSGALLHTILRGGELSPPPDARDEPIERAHMVINHPGRNCLVTYRPRADLAGPLSR